MEGLSNVKCLKEKEKQKNVHGYCVTTDLHWIIDHAEETHRRMEVALSQSEINSLVAEQQATENLLGKRAARRQGYRSRGPSSSSTSFLVSS